MFTSSWKGKVISIEEIQAKERQRIREEVEKMTTKCPERESDEYDQGQEDFKNRVLKLLNPLKEEKE